MLGPNAEDREHRVTSRAIAVIIASSALWLIASGALIAGFARAVRRERAALERARTANVARDETLSIVAHDLRSPLGAVLLKATMIRSAAPPAIAKQAESIELIVMRMERYIRSLLDVANLDAGQLAISPQRCDADELVTRTAESFAALAASKSIHMDVAHPRELVLADRERMLQVLSNLVDNAIKFTAEHGTVTICTDRAGAEVRFCVKDTGRGIRPEHLPHLFERSWKAEPGGKRGTGLGLYVANRIVEAHGGRMWAESSPGAGSTFAFTLPAFDSGAAPALGDATHQAVT